MELNFQTTQLSYLKPVLHQIHRMEETGETIVPDRCPDIGSIVDAYAGAILRGKDCRDGCVSVSGGIKGGLLYLSEEEREPHVLEFYLPFNAKLDHPQLTAQSRVLCDVRVQSVDGKMINSRKAMLRVNLGFYVDGYEKETEIFSHLKEVPDWLQVLPRTYPLHVPLAYDEKSFSLHETIDVPGFERLYKLLCRPEVTEQKVLGNKAVFKGNLNYKAVYLTQEGKLRTQSNTVPFSQYCQMEQDFDEEKLRVIPVVTGYDWNTEGEGTGKKGALTIHILAQCVVSGTRELSVIEDAYSLNGTLEGEWNTSRLYGCLDHQKTTLGLRPLSMAPFQTIMDTEFYPGFPNLKREEDQIICEIPVSVHAVGENHDGELASCIGIGIAEFRNPACPEAECAAWVSPICNGYGLSASDSTEVRGEILLEWRCYGGQSIKTLYGGRNIALQQERPAVILRYLSEDSILWDLAKTCAARETVIRAVNHLDDDIAPAGKMLLVPIG